MKKNQKDENSLKKEAIKDTLEIFLVIGCLFCLAWVAGIKLIVKMDILGILFLFIVLFIVFLLSVTVRSLILICKLKEVDKLTKAILLVVTLIISISLLLATNVFLMWQTH